MKKLYSSHKAINIIWIISELGLVSSGVKTILENHPNSFLYPVVFATLKSSGFMIVKYCEQILLSGLSKAFVLPHHATKTMVVAACLLTAQQMDMLSVDYNDLFCGLVMISIFVRLLTSWVFKVGKSSYSLRYFWPNYISELGPLLWGWESGLQFSLWTSRYNRGKRWWIEEKWLIFELMQAF